MIDLPNSEVMHLLQKIGRGDEAAATALYRHYFGFLYAYIRHQLPDDDASEEVAQEVFLSAFTQPAKFAGLARFSTWLCAIAKFKAADWWRKSRRTVPLQDVDDETLDGQLDPDWDFTESMSVEQDHAAMRHCMDRLKSIHREVLFAVYYESQGVTEVANSVGCPVGTVQTRLFYARRMLRGCMESWIKGDRNG